MFKTTLINFSKLRITTAAVVSNNTPAPFVIQIREKGHLNRPRLRNPYWFVRKERLGKEDALTPENKEFLQEYVQEKFGPPAIIKGVQTFDQSSSTLINVEQFERQAWTTRARRCGLIARKIGQYPLWLKNGKKLDTTLLQVVDNHVIKYTPPEEYKPAHSPRVVNLSRYGCLLVGAERTDPTYMTKEYCGLFESSGVMPTKNLVRFLVTPDAAIAAGTPLNVGHFRVGDFVDVRAKTVDHGFQGVVKRHGFKGMPASHGVTKTHRRPGNIGGGGEKGRVWPGTKLPGHMGNRWRKAKGLRIWRINTKYNVMWVQGHAIPGATNGLVYIYDTMLPLRKPKESPPFPTLFDDDEEAKNAPEDIWYDTVHCFKDETIIFKKE